MENNQLQLQIDKLTKDLQALNDKLTKDLQALNEEFYRNNFSARQDFNKYSDFRFRLKIPHYAALPTTGEVGEILEYNGKLYVCTTANTFVVSGTQV